MGVLVMREAKGDLWTYPADVRVITTNGSVRKDGAAVMGGGVALQAKWKYHGIERDLGTALAMSGNQVHWLNEKIVSFPVKHQWFDEKADIDLIKRSARQLVGLTNMTNWQTIAMPRPGCGNGGLDWEDVKPIIESILDDRFVVIQR
jgi:O-acetyl-ADP-ribose deacetylase (regulator of RNase III)